MVKLLTLIALVALLSVATARADVLTFENDYDGFVEAAGSLSMIDFETLPDGEPSMAGVEITDEFNYDDQGVHFSSPFRYPLISGNDNTGFRLATFEDGEDTWIIASLVSPGLAVGAFFPGYTELCAFDGNGDEIACVQFSGAGDGFFVGIVSDDPIHSATFSEGGEIEVINSFVFTPVPEPGTIVLLASGGALTIRRRRSRGAM